VSHWARKKTLAHLPTLKKIPTTYIPLPQTIKPRPDWNRNGSRNFCAQNSSSVAAEIGAATLFLPSPCTKNLESMGHCTMPNTTLGILVIDHGVSAGDKVTGNGGRCYFKRLALLSTP
jgi:hypothetical protein